MEYNTDHSGYPEYEQPLLPEDNQMLTEEKRRFAECLDEDIVEMSHNGDAAAEEYLLDKYKNFVRSKARSYFLVGADHEDIVQEGMIGLYKAIRDYRPDKLSSFRAFAHRDQSCYPAKAYSAE